MPGGRARAARRRRAAGGDGRGDAGGREAGSGRRDRGGADRACPLEGRRIWLVGIGGAGLSAYGLLARGWGAEVGGWDRNETPYLGAGARRRGSRCACRRSPRRRTAGRCSSRPRTRGVGGPAAGRPARGARRGGAVDRRRRRAREDDDRGDDRVRAARDGPRPELDRRRRGAAARRERRRGGGLARRRGRRVGPVGRSASPARGCGHERRPRPPREFGSPRGGRGAVRGVAARGARGGARLGARARWTSSSPCPASTTGGTRLRRWRRSSLPASRATEAATRSPGSRASAAGSSSSARPGACACTTTTRTTRRSCARRSRPRASRRARGACSSLFQPHLYSRTLHSARELGAALAAADVVAVADVYPAREAPVAGVTGKLVVDALCDVRPGFAPGWTPRLEDGAAFLVHRARPATSPSRSGPATSTGARAHPGALEALVSLAPVDTSFHPRHLLVTHACGFRRYARSGEEAGHAGRRDTGHVRKGHVKIEEGVRLAKLTTVGIGGPAARSRGRLGSGAGGSTRLGGRARPAGAPDRARLEPARRGRRGRRARRPARGRARRRATSRASCSSPAGARRTRSACTAPAPPGSAGSSSPARSPAPRAEGCG